MATESILKDFYLQDDAAVERFLELLEMPPIKFEGDGGAYKRGKESLDRILGHSDE